MRRTAKAKAVATLVACCLALGGTMAQAAESAALSGVVIRAGDRAPITGAKVWAADPASGKLFPATTDAADGSFDVELPAATYELGVELDGGLYLSPTPVPVAPGQARTVQVAVDPSAQPMGNARVDPADPTYVQGTPSLWSNPLTAALIVLGAAVVVGVVVEEATDDEDELAASPFEE